MKIELSPSPMLSAARKIAERLAEHGHHARIVGGAVRDSLAGRPVKDIDLVTDATPEETRAIFFPDAEMVGAAFGVLIVKLDGLALELASARSERFYMDGRHPTEVRYTRDFALDAARRDFTVNALMYDFATGCVIDYFTGLEDLERGVLRTVGDPEQRFGEDYLRMLRAVRFAAKLRFEIEPATLGALKLLAPRCAVLAAERVKSELDCIFNSVAAERGLRLLESTGLLAVLLPEIARLRTVEQDATFHPEGDVLEHTALMLKHMVIPDVVLAWGIVLHDVGKADTAEMRDNRWHFYCHEISGAETAGRIMEKLRFSRSDAARIGALVRNHMRLTSIRQVRQAKLRRWLSEEDFALELELNRIDCAACHRLFDSFVCALDELARLDGRPELPPPLITGKDLIALGMRPGREFKRILENLRDLQLSGEITSRDEALEYLAENR